jgi:hypothetical protein
MGMFLCFSGSVKFSARSSDVSVGHTGHHLSLVRITRPQIIVYFVALVFWVLNSERARPTKN